tara:strand:- start:1024 stop:1554 length:531 start_codon:yes stop_codon:yes gene_type:complete
MHNRLIIYSTTDGQTKLICERIKNFSKFNNQTKIISINEVMKENLSSYETIIIGASIRYGKHNPFVFNFVKENLKILNNKKSVFFSVNVVARKAEKNLPENNPYIIKFLKLTNWNPDKKAVFAGKIDYPKYSFFDRQIIRLIMFITKGPTDTSKSYEFTEWSKVDDFAREIDNISA